MTKEIKELNNEILRTTQSVVVHTPNYSKFGGYEGERDIYTMDIAKAIYTAGYRKQSNLTPCDVCKFNPPSSGDGKPCFMCPAQAKGGAE